MLQRFSSRGLVIAGGLLIVLAAIGLLFLPLQVILSFDKFVFPFVQQHGRFLLDGSEIIPYLTTTAISYLLLDTYVFLVGITLLIAELFSRIGR